MRSSNVGQVLPASAFSYSVSLRVRHPTLDLSVLTEKLRLEPAHSWTAGEPRRSQTDRKSTRLNSSHLVISYAVFCLKKKKNTQRDTTALYETQEQLEQFLVRSREKVMGDRHSYILRV